MRSVSGPTDRVVVIGAGLGGLSAAMRLTGSGRQVTVLERDSAPGGVAGRLEIDGYAFDTGPTVLTMPGLIADAFASMEEQLDDWLTFQPLDPVYRATFSDGSSIDVHSDVDAMADEVSTVCGPASADGYRRFVNFAKQLYELEMDSFIDRNFDSPLSLASMKSLQLLKIGGFRRLANVAAEFLPDERLQRIFSFQSLYAGLSPYDALAIYAVISYMDCVAGVVAPIGGMHAIPQAMAAAASKHGADFRYDTEASRIEFIGDRAVAVLTTSGERIPCDAVVVNADLSSTWQTLLNDRRTPRRFAKPGRLTYSPSCVVLHVGSKLPSAGLSHHSIHFGDAWRQTFNELIDQRQVMSDPSLLVSCPTVSDPSLAPDGKSVFYVLAPTPNLDADINWSTFAPLYRDQLVCRLESLGYQGFDAAIEVEQTITPLDWGKRGMTKGTPFSLSHTFAQTGPFRPGNMVADNVVFAGAGTRPGVGVPMVLLSGKLAAERLTGGRS